MGLNIFYKNFHGYTDQQAAQEGIQPCFTDIQKLNEKLETMKHDIQQTSIRSINQAAFVNLETLMIVLELSLGVAVNCENTE